MDETKKKMQKKRESDTRSSNGEQENQERVGLSIKPAGAVGLVDTMLFELVIQTQDDGDEHSLLHRICANVVEKALTGNIEACKLLFDRVSGAAVQTFAQLDNEEDLVTSFGIS